METNTHPSTTQTREEWLERAVATYFRGVFDQVGYPLPGRIHLSVGWSHGGGGAESRDVLGNCWSGVASADSYPHVFISPVLAESVTVLTVLAHELVHAALDPVMDHGREFRACATAIGLVGPMTATTADAPTTDQYRQLARRVRGLGPYPHSPLSLLTAEEREAAVARVLGVTDHPVRVASGPAPQRARWLRVRCPDHPAGGSVMTTRTTVARHAAPLCGEPVEPLGAPCGRRMELPH